MDTMTISHQQRLKAMQFLVEIIAALLVLLFVYTAVSKWADFADFKSQLYNQVFSKQIASILLYTLPTVELLTASA